MRKIQFWCMTVVWCMVWGAAAVAGIADCTGIATDKGPVMGRLNEKSGVCVYKGIPYAAPPVGALRFKAPQAPAAWTGTLKAGKFGNECVQFPMGLVPASEPVGNEDCLYLNVWQPAAAADGKMPVMVWIHGGGFVLGSGSQDLYDGTNLASDGKVLVVSLNYRLGPFGFLVHPALADANGHMGNYGMLDQVAALQWVKTNIANFGGDPDNITVFGQSAGAMSVSLLTLSPMTDGLFNKAIIQSGSAAVLNKNEKDETATGVTAAERLGCKDLATAADCLRAVDPAVMMKTIKPTIGLMSDAELKEGFPFHPVIDGFLLPDVPIKLLRDGKYDKSRTIMMGTTKDEATIFLIQKKVVTADDFFNTFKTDMEMVRASFGIDVQTDEILNYYPLASYPTPRDAYNDLFTDLAFTCPTRKHAEILADNGGTVFLYHFLRAPSTMGLFKDLGSFHSAELFFNFGNWKFMGMNLGSAENFELSSQMIQLWASFAHSGKPAAQNIPAWPAFTSASPQYLEMDLASAVKSNLKDKECKFQGDVILDSFGK